MTTITKESKQEKWEKDLRKIKASIVSPDGDGSWSSSISGLTEYPELVAFIRTTLTAQKEKIINKVKITQTKNEEGFYYQDLISKKQLLKELL